MFESIKKSEDILPRSKLLIRRRLGDRFNAHTKHSLLHLHEIDEKDKMLFI